ncbi:PCYCGC motif-containing (lipo)protein [Effusibacillus consociatus]|uniref:PCYCGC motif-containing (Lipo)protein n=1 Tax=Effusibacillus consociatus TaxID=1117041 RepID=A0ABV9Q2Z3_9BACL
MKSFRITILGLVLVLSGCSSSSKSTDVHSHEIKVSKDKKTEATNGVDTLPSFLSNSSQKIREVYSLAAKNYDLLHHIPCYCGCGQLDGHKSVSDCFVKDVRQNSVVTWDSHGSNCGVCLNIVAYSVELQKEGKSIKEIRTKIDERYKEHGKKPTHTPIPN